MTWSAILLVLHILGTVIGAGAATVADMLFLRALKDGKIDSSERDLLSFLSVIVWSGLLLLVASGLGFFLVSRLGLTSYHVVQNAAFWTKMLAVAVLFVNGLVLNVWVQPLIDASVGKPFGAFIQKRKRLGLVLTCGAISIASWYTALILGAWRSIPLHGWQLPAAYGVFLLMAMLSSHFVLGPKVVLRSSSSR